MGEMIIEAVTTNVLDIVLSIITIVVGVYLVPMIKNELRPWLEEKRVYNLVSKFVEAAEKLAETGVIEKINKKKTVVELLEKNGVEVTPYVDAFIESAVKQLDIVINTVKEEVSD